MFGILTCAAVLQAPLVRRLGIAHQVDRSSYSPGFGRLPGLRGMVGACSLIVGCSLSPPPVAEGSFQAAQGRVDEAVALVVGAAGAHPAQAGVVEEAEVAPQGEVVAVAPAAADHLGQGRHRRLPRLPSHPGRLVARVVPGQHLVGHPAGGALGDEVQVGPHPVPGRRPLRQGVVGSPSALGELVGRGLW